MMAWLIIWLGLALATAIVASNKGHNRFFWFFIGLMLCPIGFIIALVIGKNVKRLEQIALEHDELQMCPYCAEIIKSEAIKCRYCNSDLPTEDKKPKNDRRATIKN
jgi:hypothetical protein